MTPTSGPLPAGRPPGTGGKVGAGRTGGRAREDGRYAARASRGTVAAFSRLVEAHSGLVRGVALRVLGPDLAQDASQEVWIEVWRNIEGFRGESAFATWLYRVAMNTCLSTRQKESRRTAHHHGEAPYLAEPADGDADPESSALDSERRGELEDALGRIRADHRAALVLRHMEGVSHAKIAEVLEVPDGTARGWVSRGRDAMLVALTKRSGPA